MQKAWLFKARQTLWQLIPITSVEREAWDSENGRGGGITTSLGVIVRRTNNRHTFHKYFNSFMPTVVLKIHCCVFVIISKRSADSVTPILCLFFLNESKPLLVKTFDSFKVLVEKPFVSLFPLI